ncbi:hypothetical protein WDW89_08235 [Deltaproteobacteria bacterium TL4]
MLLTVEETRQKIKKNKTLFLAGDERLLRQLPKGTWVGGTIPYFMDETGGLLTEDKIFTIEAPAYIGKTEVKWYDEANLPSIPEDAPENGFSIIIIPATSAVHITYAQNAPNYKDIFLKPIIGWISGVNLENLGKITPKVFNGKTAESSDQKAVVMHIQLPDTKQATIGIVNLFKQGSGDSITFETEGFSVKDCFINGTKRNFSEYILAKKIDTKLPLVADYCGAMVNVSFQEVKVEERIVNLYAPVFQGVEYKIAAPVNDYVSEFRQLVPTEVNTPVFSCNCILNYLYSELEGKKTGSMVGPITFGEVAYQLLNQTLVYLDARDV